MQFINSMKLAEKQSSHTFTPIFRVKCKTWSLSTYPYPKLAPLIEEILSLQLLLHIKLVWQVVLSIVNGKVPFATAYFPMLHKCGNCSPLTLPPAEGPNLNMDQWLGNGSTLHWPQSDHGYDASWLSMKKVIHSHSFL